jgi:hypothetical protein
MSKLKTVRTRLYKKNPICPFCGVKMILPEDIGFIKTMDNQQALKENPDNLCTIEHIYSRFNPKRKNPNIIGERRRMICCKKCNMARGRQEEICLGVAGLKKHAEQIRLRKQKEDTGIGLEPIFEESKSSVIALIRSGNTKSQKSNLFSRLFSYIFS